MTWNAAASARARLALALGSKKNGKIACFVSHANGFKLVKYAFKMCAWDLPNLKVKKYNQKIYFEILIVIINLQKLTSI